MINVVLTRSEVHNGVRVGNRDGAINNPTRKDGFHDMLWISK